VPDVLVVVADATNLRLVLRLALEIRAVGLPAVMALNMYDIAERNGLNIELEHLSSHLGFDVEALVLNKRFDAKALLQKIENNLAQPSVPAQIYYDEIVEQHLETIWQSVLSKDSLADTIAHPYLLDFLGFICLYRSQAKRVKLTHGHLIHDPGIIQTLCRLMDNSRNIV